MKNNKAAKDMSVKELTRFIDYSILKPEFSHEDVKREAENGIKLECKTLCINPGFVEFCEDLVKGTNTNLCPVVDFPFGTSSTKSRVEQIRDVAKYETVEDIDIVAKFGLLRGGEYDLVLEDLKECAKAAHEYGKNLKVIFETDTLNEEQIRKLCDIVVESGADFVKTSTGFITGFDYKGASKEVMEIMVDQVAGRCKIKASAGIRTREYFLELIDMGIDRIAIGFKSIPVVLGFDDNKIDDNERAY